MIGKIRKNFKELISVNSFGARFSILLLLVKLLPKKYSTAINTKRIKEVQKWIYKFYNDRPLAENTNVSANEKNKNIWFFWWQGVENAPDTIKMCLNSLKVHFNKDVIVITKDNYMEYTNINKNTLDKFIKGKITITHFSDILRFNLLSEHGGLWLDSTIIATGECDYIFDKAFWTINRSYDHSLVCVSECKWNISFLYGSGIFFDTVKEMLDVYWSVNDCMIDFFLIDYIVDYLYQTDINVKNMIDAVSISNRDVYDLSKKMNHKFDTSDFAQLTNTTQLHKLNWRDAYVPSIEGHETYYGYLSRKYTAIKRGDEK